ncbi:MAG: FecR family protein [Daejeonella sp.]
MMAPLNSDARYQELAAKWLNNTISEKEKEEFSSWYNSGQDSDYSLPPDYAGSDEELKARIYASIETQLAPPEKVNRFNRKWYPAAAAVLIMISAGLYFYTDKPDEKLAEAEPPKSEQPLIETRDLQPKAEAKKTSIPAHDIVAGNDKAVLTLGDGTRIILDDAKTGVLANQDGHSILKTANGELVYSFGSAGPETISNTGSQDLNFNTIETPKGGKFQVRLPDGSRVWLNAASSLKFPTAFSRSKREVELKGEAYFEVAHDEKIFEVITRNQTVQVLGTHFNINAYADEPSVNTTLLEGSVRISDLRTNNSQLLKPGEQAKLTEGIEVVNLKNTTESIAWKDGYFQFNDADIQTVMRQIERWYDVRIRYEGQIPTQRFGGEIERSLSLLQVLKVLEKTKVHFRLDGREVIVMR